MMPTYVTRSLDARSPAQDFTHGVSHDVAMLFSRGAALAFAIGLLAASPAPAERPENATAAPLGAPRAVVVRRDGGFAPRPRIYWYNGDGTAYLDGTLDVTQHGRFQARVDFERVARLLSDAELCTGAAPAPSRPLGNDMIVYYVDVLCGTRWQLFTLHEGSAVARRPELLRAVHGLDGIVQQLAWKPAAETLAPPDAALFPSSRPR
jgi:hypothetical protein